MRLLPAGQPRPSDFEDGEWLEKPGFPPVDGTWLHPTPLSLPEFEFEEGHDKTKNEPPYRLVIGTHEDAQVRLDNPCIPRRHCMVFKEGRDWFLEALSNVQGIWLGKTRLERGLPAQLHNGATFSLLQPPTDWTYRIEFDDADNWYLDLNSNKDYPNRWPAKMPGHPSESPPAPEELKRLAWQTDQMRRRSEEDQVRVADWAAFSQYVKKHYHKYGIYAKPWRGSVGPPLPRPALPGPRPYPRWIAALIAEERGLPHVKCKYPFREALELSGFECAQPLTPRAALPNGPVSSWGEANQDDFLSGGTSVMVGDGTLYEAAMRQSLALSGKKASNADDIKSSPRSCSELTPATKASAKPKKTLRKPSPWPPHLKVSFREWLTSMEDAPFVVQYHDAIAAQFDSLGQIADLYVHNNALHEHFFDVVGIRKLGHKRIFEKWFRDHPSQT